MGTVVAVVILIVAIVMAVVSLPFIPLAAAFGSVLYLGARSRRKKQIRSSRSKYLN